MRRLSARWRRLIHLLTTRKIVRWREIPVFVVVRDRVAPLCRLVSWLEQEGMRTIVLVDNDSSYPPLLEYLKTTPHRVVWLGKNAGPYAPWLPEIRALRVPGRPYIVTDPDVVPGERSHGAVKRFAFLLNRYPGYQKAGFGLRIDDLPDHYELKDQVIAAEQQYWDSPIAKDLFHAPIDTTFALYRGSDTFVFGPALRTGGRFTARHEPWYVDSAAPSDELAYYRARARSDFATWPISADENT